MTINRSICPGQGVWFTHPYGWRMECVYRAYDANGTLLYIGETRDFEMRRAQHMADAIWRNQVARWRVRWYMDGRDAQWAEYEAIRSEHPRWNVQNRSVNHPEGPARTLREIATRYPDNLARPTSPSVAKRHLHLAAFFDATEESA